MTREYCLTSKKERSVLGEEAIPAWSSTQVQDRGLGDQTVGVCVQGLGDQTEGTVGTQSRRGRRELNAGIVAEKNLAQG